MEHTATTRIGLPVGEERTALSVLVGRYDVPLFIACTALLSIGTVLVYSATARTALDPDYGFDSFYFLKRHALNFCLGAVLFFAALRMPQRMFHAVARLLFPVSVLLLVAVMIPGVGVSRLGARRWISVFGYNIQPAEIAKVGFALYLAAYLERRRTVLKELVSGIVPLLVMYVMVGLLLVAQPDVGSAVLLGMMVVAMLVVGGTRLSFLGVLFGGLMAAFAAILAIQPEKLARLVGWLLPEETRMGEGYQVYNSQILVGSGGMFGSGPGQGLNHALGYLPQSENDFIFSVAGEEFGFVGVIVLAALYTVIAVRGFQLVRKCRDDFSRFAAFFLTLLLTLPAFIHMAVGLGLMPTKGLVCPFLSYGGSAMAMTMLVLGLLQRLHLDATAEPMPIVRTGGES